MRYYARHFDTVEVNSTFYTNNHFSAKSVVNAAMLKAQLGQPLEGEYPAEMVERYPELRALPITVAARVAERS